MSEKKFYSTDKKNSGRVLAKFKYGFFVLINIVHISCFCFICCGTSQLCDLLFCSGILLSIYIFTFKKNNEINIILY